MAETNPSGGTKAEVIPYQFYSNQNECKPIRYKNICWFKILIR